jgi:hypothetical protein
MTTFSRTNKGRKGAPTYKKKKKEKRRKRRHHFSSHGDS